MKLIILINVFVLGIGFLAKAKDFNESERCTSAFIDTSKVLDLINSGMIQVKGFNEWLTFRTPNFVGYGGTHAIDNYCSVEILYK